jgi:hypothetical protein
MLSALSIFNKTTRIIFCFHFEQEDLYEEEEEEKEINITVVNREEDQSLDCKLFLCLSLSVLFFS